MSAYTDTAAAHPCYFAVETAQQRYVHRLAWGSLVMTVNSGYE